MVNLGKGSSAPSRDDIHMADRLRQYMDGTPDRPQTANVSSSGGGGGGGGSAGGSGKRSVKPNVDVTSPGATVALGLIYLRTGNRAIAARLEIPNTTFHLDFIRPDCLLLRALA
jgi:anaphase-promoting complex subunit 1